MQKTVRRLIDNENNWDTVLKKNDIYFVKSND